MPLFRSSHKRCSMKKGALKNFAKFTGKQLCQSLFFNKVASLYLISKNTSFYGTPPVTASVLHFVYPFKNMPMTKFCQSKLSFLFIFVLFILVFGPPPSGGKSPIKLPLTEWKVSVLGVFLVRIFPHSYWIRRDTLCVSRSEGYYFSWSRFFWLFSKI